MKDISSTLPQSHVCALQTTSSFIRGDEVFRTTCDPLHEPSLNPPNVQFDPFLDARVQGVRVRTRKYLCYHLPEQFSPEALLANQERLATEMAACLNVTRLKPVFQQLDDNVWMLAYLHPAERDRHLATYGNDGPGTMVYRPRLAATLVFDGEGGLFFVSLPHPEACNGLETALKSVFPGRNPAEPFMPVALSLEKVLRLSIDQRHPLSPHAPWTQLRLKVLTWQTAGRDSATLTTKWVGDGFDDVVLGDLLETPERLYAATFQVVLPKRKRYTIQVYPSLGVIGFNATATPLLASIREVSCVA